AIIEKDQKVEIVRMPTHILDGMVHAEPIDDILKEGSVDVTRVNITQLRALVRVLEGRAEMLPLSRWQSAKMGPVARIDLLELQAAECYSLEDYDQLPLPLPPLPPPPSFPPFDSPAPAKDAAECLPKEECHEEKENAHDEKSLLKRIKVQKAA
ncbi:hypothetical protein PMAYCL1PPCAC_11713, partial [Pristionchus mayeri]